MAWYKYSNYLQQTNHNAYDLEYSPGSKVPYSGIYRCMGCNREIASNVNDPFPPQNHHQHNSGQGHIRWKLIAYADHDPS